MFASVCLQVKLAQMMATRSDILPDVYCRLLGKAQDQMPPRPFAEVQAMIAAELGTLRRPAGWMLCARAALRC